jgi:beta-barrel assembly-enhancing protease
MEGQSPTKGFDTSTRRVVLELVIVVTVLAAVGFLVWLGVRKLAVIAADQLPPSAERSLGQMAWDNLAPLDERCTDVATLTYVRSVLAPLLAQQPKEFQFDVTVVDVDELNAYALPGGYVTVNLGMLKAIARSEELAGVLAHELAHVTLRHATRRITAQLGTMALVGLLFGGTDIGAPAHILANLATTAYGREQETEADDEGLRTLVRAHIDPRGMAELFERLAKAGLTPPELLSSHPDPGKRAERARSSAAGVTTTEPGPLPLLPSTFSCK